MTAGDEEISSSEVKRMNPLADFPFRDHLTLQLTEKIQLQAKDVEMKKKGGGGLL